MSAPKIQADYDGLNEIAKHFAAKAQDTNCLIQTVDRCVDELRRGAWIGKGADQFYAEMQQEVSPAMLRLRNALDDASSATTRIAQALERHEREAAALFYGGGSEPSNFIRDLLKYDKDPRHGYQKALQSLVSAGIGFVGPIVIQAIGGLIGGPPGAVAGAAIGSAVTGAFSGLVDALFTVTNEYQSTHEDWQVQVASGILQGIVIPSPIGEVDSLLQAVRYAHAQFVSDNAQIIAYNDLARSEAIIRTAERISLATGKASLDSLFDSLVRADFKLRSGDLVNAANSIVAGAGGFILGNIVIPAETLRLQILMSAGLAARAGGPLDNVAKTLDSIAGIFLW